MGVGLTKLGSSVVEAVDRAREAGNALEIEGGRQLFMAIQRLQEAYASSLTKTVNTLGPELRGDISQIESALAQLQSHTFRDVNTLTSQLQQIAITLPLHNKAPRLRDVLPHFVVASATSTAPILTANGVFEFASRPGFEPVFTIGSSTVTPIRNTDQDLSFAPPVPLLRPSGPAGDAAFKFGVVEGILTIPWESSRWLGLRHRREVARYRTLITSLPESPGDILVQWRYPADSVITKRVESGDHEVCSESQCGNNDQIDKRFSLDPDPGCRVIRGTGTFDEKLAVGQRTNSIVSDVGTLVWSVTTIHKSLGTSGRYVFRLSMKEECTVPVERIGQVKVNERASQLLGLRWGSAAVIDSVRSAASWKVVFRAFDGSSAEYSGPTEENPFLKVRFANNAIQLVTPGPSQLVWTP